MRSNNENRSKIIKRNKNISKNKNRNTRMTKINIMGT